MIVGQERAHCEIEFEKLVRTETSANSDLNLKSAKVQLMDRCEGLSVNRKEFLEALLRGNIPGVRRRGEPMCSPAGRVGQR